MKFRTEKALLEKTMARIDTIVPGKDFQTLLSNVLIQVEDGKVHLTASDMESTVRISIEAGDTENGELIIPAKKLSEIAKQLRSEELILAARPLENQPDGEETAYEVSVSGNQATAANFRLTGGNRSHFPDLNSISDRNMVTIPSAVLEEMIHKTFYSISHEDNRYIYNGICFQAEKNRMTLIGTDGRRLAAINREFPSPVQFYEPDSGDIVVHAKAIRELQRILDSDTDVRIGVQQRDIMFEIGDAKLSSRLLEGKFPDYKKVIPGDLQIEFDIDRESFFSALSQVKVMTEPPSFQVKLVVTEGFLEIHANTPDLGNADIKLPVDYSGDTLEIGFNASYILDILRSLDCPVVRLGFIDANKPIVVKDKEDSEYLSLVMPMKI